MSKGHVVALALLLLTGACSAGGDSQSPESASEQASETPVGPTVGPASSRVLPGDITTLQVVQGASIGDLVADREAYTLYRYEKDVTSPPRSSCNDPECTLVWPPLLAPVGQFDLKGVDKALVGTMKRDDGTTQVTLAGRPLYRYVDDEQAGDAKGNGLDGQWFAVAPSGEKARG
ncbi:hypothetical protein SK854_13780 [Lentzea sp. BCCO 10_0061]|uniref:Lipoprotein with Yx(FWY)xxD motif n=1 Tax=Lentzea sokolovensis TaxID=3095429 RepID=A0ABU4UVK8_9PSEU|nr:hypothetical protein [Lentzea sp. BCCO 10_0061]MDX8143192.1 hypothetical protein [Lentzea sp. BCCO 10_0061]